MQKIALFYRLLHSLMNTLITKWQIESCMGFLFFFTELLNNFLDTLLIGFCEMKALELVDFFGLRKIEHSATVIVGRCFHCGITDLTDTFCLLFGAVCVLKGIFVPSFILEHILFNSIIV